MNDIIVNPTTTTIPTLSPMIRVPAGRGGFKYIQQFGEGGARQIKDAIKTRNPSLKGRELNKMVKAVLNGEKSLREQLGVAFVQACIQSGKVPDHGEVTKNGAKLVFVNAKPIVEVQSVEADYENMSADQIADLLHKLEGMLDAKVASMEETR